MMSLFFRYAMPQKSYLCSNPTVALNYHINEMHQQQVDFYREDIFIVAVGQIIVDNILLCNIIS